MNKDQQAKHDEVKLPPLPETKLYDTPAGLMPRYDRFQMRDYALAAIAQLCAKPDSAEQVPTQVEQLANAMQLHADMFAKYNAVSKELARIKRVAACGTVDSFLALPDQDKRYWFVNAIDESEMRKKAQEENFYAHESGLNDARKGIHELNANENVDFPGIEGDKPIARFIYYTDGGDSSVGIPGTAYWALAPDQDGTLLADLLAAPLNIAQQAPMSDAEHANYAALEKEYLGDPDKQTGIYAPKPEHYAKLLKDVAALQSQLSQAQEENARLKALIVDINFDAAMGSSDRGLTAEKCGDIVNLIKVALS